MVYNNIIINYESLLSTAPSCGTMLHYIRTMHHDRLQGLLTMSIEQKLTYSLNIDEV